MRANLRQIADWLGLSADADTAESDARFSGIEITRVCAPEDATSDAAVFATDAKALSSALRSEAGLILTTAELAGGVAPDPRLLTVREPRYGFTVLSHRLAAAPSSEIVIHTTATIGEDVSIGPGTTIGAGVWIGDGVVLGRGCVLAPTVTIYKGSVLGDRVVVKAGAVLGSEGFGFARNSADGTYLRFPQQGRLIIGDEVEIGANTTIDRGALGETRIGRGTKIDNLVHIGHNCCLGSNVIVAAQTGISGSSIVEDGAILGGQVGIGEHATVGAGVILGGGAGVLTGKKMQGPGQVFWGRPARPLKEYLRDLARLRRG